MAVEKMSLVSVSGPIKRVNKALVKCCETECFHIEPSYYKLTYGTADFKKLKDKNIYRNLMIRAERLSDGLGISDISADYDDIAFEVLHDFDEYFKRLESEVGSLIDKKNELIAAKEQYAHVLRHVENLSLLHTDFRDLFNCKHVKVRLGRMPSDSYRKLELFSDKNFVFEPLDENDGYVWGVCFAAIDEKKQIDDIFKNLYFEKVRIPDYVSGDGETAVAELSAKIEALEKEFSDVSAALSEVKEREKNQFSKVVGKLKFLNDSYELRSQVSVIDSKFYMVGFVPKRELEKFIAHVSVVPDIEIDEKKFYVDDRIMPPTKLRNNWLFRPFEMFVKMYGMPSYNGIDPTAYVAVTFMLIYGIMFGDLGQGLVISLLGVILDKWRKVKLAPIMQRIGISSAVFGYFYGSVFGNEEIITPFFHIEPLYSVMGKPDNIFQASTYLLIAALVIGVILIAISMIMNIILSIKRHDIESAFFGTNGVTGMVFYLSVVVGAGLQLAVGIEMFTPLYILLLILLPLAIMFFKEPISHFTANSVKQNVLSLRKTTLIEQALMNSTFNNKQELAVLEEHTAKISDMKSIRSVYGRLPLESYYNISSRCGEMDFVFIPLSESDEFVYGVSFAPKKLKSAADSLLEGLGFVRMKTPPELLRTERRKHISKPTDNKTHKKSLGNFIIEGVIELFESCLSYLTNTMSFLRVGGFILSHAGMMLVVNVLAGSEVNTTYVIVQIIGNLFVIGMEGFIVGIQVLRLEFYEIFGRFYKGDGRSFTPLKVK